MLFYWASLLLESENINYIINFDRWLLRKLFPSFCSDVCFTEHPTKGFYFTVVVMLLPGVNTCLFSLAMKLMLLTWDLQEIFNEHLAN